MTSVKLTWKTYSLLAALTINSLLLNGYRYDYNILTSWLRKENNPEFYENDFFINTVSKVEISWFYEIVKKISAYVDLPLLFFSIHIISLSLMCFFLFLIAYELTGRRITAYASVLMFSMGIRQWVAGAPQIYYFFVHHSAFSLPFFLLIIAMFLKRKFVLSFFLLGLMANFHLMFVIYVSVALSIPFLLAIYEKRCSLKKAGMCLIAFLIPAIPSIYHTLQVSGQFVVSEEWFRIVKWTIWIHILPSKWNFEIIRNFAVYLLCFSTAFKAYPKNDNKKNLCAMFAGIAVFCMAGTFFVEVYPLSIFTQLQAWRSTWIFFILSIPVFANFITLSWSKSFLSKFAAISTLLVYGGYVSTEFNNPRCYFETPYWMLPFFMLLCITAGGFNISLNFKKIASVFLAVFSIIILAETLFSRFEGWYFDIGMRRLFILALALSAALLFSSGFIINLKENGKNTASVFVMIVIFTAVILLRGGTYFPLKGYVDGREGEWEKLQFFVRNNTPRNALFIVPPYLAYPDFRFYSQRASFGDWVDGGFSVYLGSEFAKEWSERMKSIGLDGSTFYDESFELERQQYASLKPDEIIKTGKKYGAQFFVSHKRNNLPFEKIYENKTFILYKISGNT